MVHDKIDTKKAPPPGSYSQARTVDTGKGWWVYTAGQTGNHPVTDEVAKGGIEAQTSQALENIKAVVEECDGTIDDIVEVTVFIKDMAANRDGFEAVYKPFFAEAKMFPARSMVEAVEIPLVKEDTIVEIKAVAYIAKCSDVF